ncbi:MAG: methyl-accepting chemotaxis protein [Clostridia bacterium]|nr:methyl-accepting chemotaxis protein [Clostridia bacterium]
MFNNMSIRNKIWATLSIALGVIIVATLVFIFVINNLVADFKMTIHDEGLESLDNILNADRDMYQALSAIQKLNVMNKNDAKYGDIVKEYQDNVSQVNERMEKSQGILKSNEKTWGQVTHEKSGKKIFDNYAKFKEDFDAWTKNTDALIKSGDLQTIQKDEYIKSFNSARSCMNEIGELVKLSINKEIAAGVSEKNQTIITVIIIVAIGFVLVILLSLYVTSLITKSLDKAVYMMNEMSKGHLDYRVDVGTKDEIGKMAEAMNQFANKLQKDFVGVLKSISQGDLSAKIQVSDDLDEITPALKRTIESLVGLTGETQNLINSAVDGRFEVRGDGSQFMGVYRDIIEGINKTVDAFVTPIQEVSAVMNELSSGNLDVMIQKEYKGDFVLLKNAVNLMITDLKKMILDMSEVLSGIAGGNLNYEKIEAYKGDYKAISDAMNTILESLNELIGEISKASDQVAAGARQVSDGSMQLSQGATEQASSIEELSSTITQISAQTKQNATNANKANELAFNAKEMAVKGNTSMAEMLKAMEQINDASSNISKIIKVIDEIAFQTNILALNAAVEAARAGQHGKGFAVVAEEVRNLAARSADAAKETTEFIETSIKKVDAGTKMANETADSLSKIVDGSAQVAELVGEIAKASNEQASGIAQINIGVEQVSKVIQTNSATAEESAAASEELMSQAELLNEHINGFNLRESFSSYNQRKKSKDVKGSEKKESQKLYKKSGRSANFASGEFDLGNSDFGRF